MKITPLRAVAGLLVSSALLVTVASFADAPAVVLADGGRYYGPLVDGRLHGRGRIEWDNGERYEGEFAEGLFSGQGTFHYKDGDKYQGEFARGDFHGKGRYEDADGDVYEGKFESGEPISGSHVTKAGARYEGGFRKWRFHGKGRYDDGHGTSYEGRFVDGSLEGRGKVSGKGSAYEGELKQWRFHGRGVLRLANGDVYEGGFERGMYQGKGTLTYREPRDGRTKESGVWRYGRLFDAEEERKQLSAMEAAIYEQPGLLDKALAVLEPSRPGSIDMYLLTVAGDGSQEVFRREVEFVGKTFAERFGTAGRSVALVNSRNTLASAPMATVTSIRAALRAIGRRMDRDEDILFLFLTSHGSQEHELVLNQRGMSLRGLPAAELGTLLRESGIRWKVVVVSACYSGGFIDALRDEHTLVMTAARRDRRSFGCADENDFTFFGRAFFKEALPGASSFPQAFHKAAALVEEWERKDIAKMGGAAGSGGSEHSLPQIHQAPAIEAHLQRWWPAVPAR